MKNPPKRVSQCRSVVWNLAAEAVSVQIPNEIGERRNRGMEQVVKKDDHAGMMRCPRAEIITSAAMAAALKQASVTQSGHVGCGFMPRPHSQW